MKTVYITDLDGTFLNNHGQVSEYTKKVVNSLIDEGMHFSYATARSGSLAYSTIDLLNDIKINAPVFLMQGALTYNYHSGGYIDCKEISNLVLDRTIQIFKDNNIPIFLLGIIKHELTIFYEELTPYLIDLYNEWSTSYNIKFIAVKSINQVKNHNVLHLFTIHSYDILKKVNELLIQCDILSIAFFDANRKDQGYHLECLNKDVSKFQVVMDLRHKYGFDRVVGFGDSTNDIPLLLACDEFYAPLNANEQLKSMSTGVIKSNDDDGVANFLLKHYKKYRQR